MPIKIPKMAGKLYRPSNGTEGELFMAQFCDQCAYEDVEQDRFCDIATLTMGMEADDERYPKEWVFDEEGRPKCTKFKKTDLP